METAVSIPDPVFQRAEHLARRTNRSLDQVYTAAIDEYVARNSPDEVTAAINRVLAETGEDSDPFVAAASYQTLKRTEW